RRRGCAALYAPFAKPTLRSLVLRPGHLCRNRGPARSRGGGRELDSSSPSVACGSRRRVARGLKRSARGLNVPPASGVLGASTDHENSWSTGTCERAFIARRSHGADWFDGRKRG